MGAVADAVGGALGAVLDPIKQIGHIAESAVREVGHACESVGREVGKVGQAAVNDPVGTIAKVAAIATQQYWALPLISAATVVAHGGDLGQAALAAGISYAAGAIAVGVGEALGAGSSAALDMAAADTANLSAQGLTASQISDVLAQSYPEIGTSAIQRMAEMGSMGIPAAEMAAEVGSKMATQNLLANAAGNTVGGATRAALSGGSGSDILMGGITSGAGSLAGGYASQELKDMGVNGTVANVLGKATGAATASTIAGRDAKLSFINSLINTTLAESGKQVGSELKAAWNSVNESASKFNDQLTKAQEDYKTKLTPLEQEAKAAQEVAAKSFDEYKPIRDQFSDLVKQYDEAKAAGDTEKANSLADQANALIPQLNAATDKYNGDVATFDTKLANYNGAAEEYKKQTDAIAAAKTEYDTRNANLQQTTKDFTEKAVQVADMGDNAKSAFQKLYDNGTKLNDSFDTAKTISGMSDVAGGSFLRQYGQTQDSAASLDFANKVNSLDTNAQASYAYAVNTGLDDSAALQYAPNLSGLSKESQQIFLDGIKSGQDPKAAETMAILSEFFRTQNVTPTNTPVDINTASASTNNIGKVTVDGLPTTGTDVGIVPNTTFRYNSETGRYDIPVVDTAGGSSNQGAIDVTADRGTPLTAEQQAAGEALDAKLAKGEITQAEYDAKLKEIEGMGTTTSGTGSGNLLNNPNLADNTFTSTNTNNAPTTGTAPVGTPAPIEPGNPNLVTPKDVTNAPPTGLVAPTGPAATVMTPWYNAKTGETYNAPSGGWTSTDPNWQQGSAPAGGGTAPVAGTPGTGSGGTGNGTGTGSGGTGTGGTGTGGVGIGGVGIGGVGIGGAGGSYNYGTSSYANDYTGGIRNLTPGLTQKMDYTLTGLPNINEATSEIPHFAAGTSVDTASSDPFSTGIGGTTDISKSLVPGYTKAQLNYMLTGIPPVQSRAEGGQIVPEGHNPSFFSEGGLGSIDNRYVKGEGDGTSDSVAAMLANGEYVIPADVVSKLGNGSNEAGAGVLDQFLKVVRIDAQSNGDKLPPKSKGPLAYLLDAKRNVKA